MFPFLRDKTLDFSTFSNSRLSDNCTGRGITVIGIYANELWTSRKKDTLLNNRQLNRSGELHDQGRGNEIQRVVVINSGIIEACLGARSHGEFKSVLPMFHPCGQGPIKK